MTVSPNTTAVILVGGLGTRLRPVVSDVPKPMAAVNGRPFLEYLMDYLLSSGVTKVIFAVGYMAEIIENHFGNHWHGIEVSYSREQAALGTGGAIINAARHVPNGDSVIVINGDTYFPVSLDKMVEQHENLSASLSIAMFESDEVGRYSSFAIDDKSRILSVEEGGSSIRSGGVYLLSAELIDLLKTMPVKNTSFETELTQALLSSGKTLSAYLESCLFIDIGVPSDYARAGQILTNQSKDS